MCGDYVFKQGNTPRVRGQGQKMLPLEIEGEKNVHWFRLTFLVATPTVVPAVCFFLNDYYESLFNKKVR